MMTKINVFRIKNALLLANAISNTIGIMVIIFILRGAGDLIAPEVMLLANRIHIFFLPLSLIIPIAIIIIYEKPIRRYLEMQHQNEPVSEAFTLIARQRLLNEPIFLILRFDFFKAGCSCCISPLKICVAMSISLRKYSPPSKSFPTRSIPN